MQSTLESISLPSGVGLSASRRPRRPRVALAAVVLGLTVLGLMTATSASARTFVVNSVGNDGDLLNGNGQCGTGVLLPGPIGGLVPECTLRAAIEESNTFPGRDRIEFADDLENAASGDISVIFVPSPPLAPITNPVDIDATTIAGFVPGPSGAPQVAVISTGADDGLVLGGGSADSTIRGLALMDFDHGIRVDKANGAWIDDCDLGFFAPSSSTTPYLVGDGANAVGIYVGPQAKNTTIGARIEGTAFVGDGNDISGNGTGIVNLGRGTSIAGNRIGTDRTGGSVTTSHGDPIGNGIGIHILSGNGLRIGRRITQPISKPPFSEVVDTLGNIVSGNLGDGIWVSDLLSDPTADGLEIVANQIGTDPIGRSGLGNGARGIFVDATRANLKIGVAGATPNLISGNVGAGIEVGPGDIGEVTIRGNWIGIDELVSNVLANGGPGIAIRNAESLLVTENVIGGNDDAGIRVELGDDRKPLEGVRVDSNWIGTNEDGVPLPNLGPGIHVQYDGVEITENTIGHNLADGIFLGHPSMFTSILGNSIGTNGDGAPLGNGGHGIQSLGLGGFVQIGEPTRGNRIGWNAGSGVQTLSNLFGTTIQANWIGAHPEVGMMPNGEHGIRLMRHESHEGRDEIGGNRLSPEHELAERANVVAYNARDGISLEDGMHAVIRGNRISENGDIAIDLNEDGHTPNDPGDGDDGANQLQNHPVLSASASGIDAASGELVVQYLVSSELENAAYPLEIDFFLADATGLQPREYLGSDQYPAEDADTWRTVRIDPLTPFPPGASHSILAMATDANGFTSEAGSPISVPEPHTATGLAIGMLTLVARAARGRTRFDGGRDGRLRHPGARRSSLAQAIDAARAAGLQPRAISTDGTT